MGLLHPDIGERLAGLQLTNIGSLSRPSIAWEQDPDTGIRHRGVQGEFSFISNGVEVGRVTADGIALPLFTATEVLFAGTGGTIDSDPGMTYASATDILTLVGGLVAPAVGPTAAQQHTLPSVTSDTVALLAATQTFTSKTLTSPILGGTVTGTYTIAGTPTVGANLLFTDNSFDIGASGATRPRDLFLAGDATIGDQLIVSGAGPHAIGGAATSGLMFYLSGNFPSVSNPRGFYTDATLNAASGGTAIASIFDMEPTIVTAAASFTLGLATTANFRSPVLTIGAGSTITTAATVRISAAPTGATNNYSLFVDAGAVRFDSSLWVEATPTEGASGEQLTSGGAATVMDWTAAACIIESKRDMRRWTNPQTALAAILSTPIYTFHYKNKQDEDGRHPSTGDTITEYVGPMAHEAPWAMHHEGRILNPINAFGYTILAVQALYNRIAQLEAHVWPSSLS